MVKFFSTLELIIEIVISFFTSLIDFFFLVINAIGNLATVVLVAPDYFKLTIFPLFSLAIVLLIIDRG